MGSQSKSDKRCKPGKCRREQPDFKGKKKGVRCKPGKCLKRNAKKKKK
jgi:hypothetical protein